MRSNTEDSIAHGCVLHLCRDTNKWHNLFLLLVYWWFAISTSCTRLYTGASVSQARTESTNVKADQRGKGEEEVIVLKQDMKQLYLV